MDSHANLTEQLASLAGADAVLEEEPLSRHTTFCIGGPAEWLVAPRSEEALCAVVALCRKTSTPLRILGLGSNVLVADQGVRGVVLKLAENLGAISVQPDGRVAAQAGASNAAIAQAAQKAGLAGYEFASGIPGTIGGAAVMNAGAYDGQLSDVAEWVRCLTPEGHMVRMTAEEAAWGYRQSRMMGEGHLVLEVGLRLAPDDPAAIQQRMDELQRRRQEKQPLELPSAGSTFKRPEGHFAGKLIQDAGMQGHRVGDAQVSTKHAGFVVNLGKATATEVLQVIADVQEKVREQAGVTLEPEVRRWVS